MITISSVLVLQYQQRPESSSSSAWCYLVLSFRAEAKYQLRKAEPSIASTKEGRTEDGAEAKHSIKWGRQSNGGRNEVGRRIIIIVVVQFRQIGAVDDRRLVIQKKSRCIKHDGILVVLS